jgi:hypothetical protein
MLLKQSRIVVFSWTCEGLQILFDGQEEFDIIYE